VSATGVAGGVDREPIAIVGVGCRFPGGAGPRGFWDLLRRGGDAVRETPPTRWGTDAYDPEGSRPGCTNSRWGGFLDDVDRFDADFFWIPAREASRMDPQHRLLLEVAWEAIEDAGILPERLSGSRTGVYVGITSKDYFRLYADRTHITGHETVGNVSAVAANRISYCLGLQGPSLAVDTTCSSALFAVHLACQALRLGDADLALAAGVNLTLIADGSVCFTKLGLNSPDGRCRAFDAHANGIVRGEGAGVVVLKPLARARADGDRIYALIHGSAVNQNGVTNGLMAPSPRAIEDLLRAAYRNAGVAVEDVGYVEAHATGTPLGDAIEARAMGAVLGRGRAATDPCRTGSVKTNVGHLEAASGMASLVKVALALAHREIPPTLHFERPNPHIRFEALGLRVVTAVEPWSAATPFAGVSALGIGGANAHVVLGAPPDAPAADPAPPPPFVLPLSARTPAALAALARRHRDFLRSPAGTATPLGDLCHTAAVRRTHHPHRLALVGRSHADLATALDDAGATHVRCDPAARRGRRRKLGLVCAGDEGIALAAVPAASAIVERVLRLFAAHGIDAGGDTPAAGTLPAVREARAFTRGLALAWPWKSAGVASATVVGVGRIGALIAAAVVDAIDLEHAVALVAARERPAQEPTSRAGQPALVCTDAGGLRAEITELATAGHGAFLVASTDPTTGVLDAAAGTDAFVASALHWGTLDRTALTVGAAALYTTGIDVAWARLAPGGRPVSLPTYPWQGDRHWYAPHEMHGGPEPSDERPSRLAPAPLPT
jgi:acyl transferase domain-containing protein